LNPEKPIIAVLDDEEQMRKALHRLLATHGFRVESYESGAALLAALSTCPFDCLVLDLHMPGLNGFDVLRALKEQNGNLPVVVITGHDMPGNVDRVLELGVAAYLLKPVDEETLIFAIRKGMAMRALNLPETDQPHLGAPIPRPTPPTPCS
jgi:FixJ family two-component response regulator